MEIKALKDLLPYCLENCTKKTLAVIKAEDDHTLTAVARARKEGAIEAVLIGDAPVIKNLLAQIGEKEEDYHIIDEAGEREAILKAIELVHAGEVDFLMKGLLETKNLMSAIVRNENRKTDVQVRFCRDRTVSQTDRADRLCIKYKTGCGSQKTDHSECTGCYVLCGNPKTEDRRTGSF